MYTEYYRVTPKKTKEADGLTFGVCVNILHKSWDFSQHLVEWLEMLRAFGVARVLANTLQVTHPCLYLVMSFYQMYLRRCLCIQRDLTFRDIPSPSPRCTRMCLGYWLTIRVLVSSTSPHSHLLVINQTWMLCR